MRSHFWVITEPLSTRTADVRNTEPELFVGLYRVALGENYYNLAHDRAPLVGQTPLKHPIIRFSHRITGC